MQRRLDIDAIKRRIAALEEQEIDIANELRELRARLWTLRSREDGRTLIDPGLDWRAPGAQTAS